MIFIKTVSDGIPDNIVNHIKICAENEGFKECDIIKVGQGNKGDGYSSTIYFLCIKDSMHRSLNVAVKIASTNEEFRKQFVTRQTFLREIHMYTKVLPSFYKFQEEHLLTEKFSSTSKCLYTSSENLNEALAFHDMKKIGYQLHDRMKPMDEEHLKFVLKEYARYHAISFAMRDKNRGLLEELGKNCNDIFSECFEEMEPVYHSNIDSCINIFDQCSENDIINRLKNFKANFKDFTLMLSNYQDKYSVITHGDCWNNNMLFLYENKAFPKKPTKMCFLDFQISRFTSVVTDLSYFFFCCSSIDCIKRCSYFIEEVYYGALAKQIQSYGCDPEKLYPLSKLREEWRKLSKFGLALTVLVLRIAYSQKDELPNFEQPSRGGNALDEMKAKSIENEDLYNIQLRAVIEYFYKDNIL